MKSRVLRLFTALVFAFAMSVAPAAFAAACPEVYVSYDGGESWSQCEHYGTIETSTTTYCYYYC
jgi:hypothetical protein